MRLVHVFFVAPPVGALVALAALAAAGEPHRALDVSRALDAGLPAVAPEVIIAPIPPDPPPLVVRADWVFDLRWDRGDVWLLDTHRRSLPAPQATPRVMGRFALELFEGRALLERVRFDFPLLGALEAEPGHTAAPALAPKLRTRIGVLFPASDRGTRLELWDRATNRRWALPWPPSPTPDAVQGDAGPDREPGPAPSP